MVVTESGEFSKNWMQLVESCSLTDQDLFDLLDEVITIQYLQRPESKPEGIDDDQWDPTAAHLIWGEGFLDLYRISSDNDRSDPYDAINMDVTLRRGRRSPTDNMELRKYITGGEVKAFWVRSDPTYSCLLNEQLEGEYLEVPLTPTRRSRIGRVALLARARTMIE